MASPESNLQATAESLRLVLKDESAFKQVVDRVYEAIDKNHVGHCSFKDFAAYARESCTALGIRYGAKRTCWCEFLIFRSQKYQAKYGGIEIEGHRGTGMPQVTPKSDVCTITSTWTTTPP
jgi:hypothetical protein